MRRMLRPLFGVRNLAARCGIRGCSGLRAVVVSFAVSLRAVIHHLFVSSGHNYFGHFGKPPGAHPCQDLPVVSLRTARGIEGDRFFGFRPDYKGQVTLFSWEVFTAAKKHFDVPALPASAMRRNVVIEGLDLPSLIGVQFRLGGIEFSGTEESRPCYWMNDAVAPGAEDWLRGNGGLRVRVLSDGELHAGPVEFEVTGGQALFASFDRHAAK